MITLGIEIGTQRTKTIALEKATGETLARTRQANCSVDAKINGAMEQDQTIRMPATLRSGLTDSSLLQ